jgi:hypothetical protein
LLEGRRSGSRYRKHLNFNSSLKQPRFGKETSLDKQSGIYWGTRRDYAHLVAPLLGWFALLGRFGTAHRGHRNVDELMDIAVKEPHSHRSTVPNLFNDACDHSASQTLEAEWRRTINLYSFVAAQERMRVGWHAVVDGMCLQKVSIQHPKVPIMHTLGPSEFQIPFPAALASASRAFLA